MARLGAVILAAGASSRLGEPKQLLVWQGRPLVACAAEAVLAAGVREVGVVVGAHAERVRAALDGLPVRVVENAAWREGMAASIRAGIEGLADADGVLVALCDQPFFTAEAAARLIETWEKIPGGFGVRDWSIVAACYCGREGAPAIFGKGYFDALRKLHGDEGARRVIGANHEHVVGVDLPQLAFDVDTPEDWESVTGRRRSDQTGRLS